MTESPLKNRKLPSLDNYDYGRPGYYFVTLCTHDRQSLFQIYLPVGNGLCAVPATPADQILCKWIIKTQRKYEYVLIAPYVILPDHIHMIVHIREQHAGCSLPDIMRYFKTMTTNDYIHAVKEGLLPPFQRQKSYYDHIIRNQQDYDEICSYIESNPARWLQSHP